MSVSSQIKSLIEEHIKEPFYVVQIGVSESKIRTKVSVFVDTDRGIEIDECGQISLMLGDVLDEKISENYTLEVSSPGADTSLKMPRQYLKNIGRTLKIVDLNGIELKGKLVELNADGLTIEPEKKKKKEILENIKILFNQIKDAKVVLSFK
jgi:ribosome maturation factor RimP